MWNNIPLLPALKKKLNKTKHCNNVWWRNRLTGIWVCLSTDAGLLGCCRGKKALIGWKPGANTHIRSQEGTIQQTIRGKQREARHMACTLPFTNMKWDIFCIKVFYHGPAGLVHQLLSQAKTSVGALHCLGDRIEGCIYSKVCCQILKYKERRCFSFIPTRDVMCPWGTSSGSSSLGRVTEVLVTHETLPLLMWCQAKQIQNGVTHIFASTYPTILPFSSSAMYESCIDENQQ